MTDVIVISSGGGGGPDRAMVGQIGHKLGRPNDGGSSGVKTLSIIETLSELATDKTEASRLTLPSPIRLSASSMKNQPASMQHPGVPPRNPKVSVPLSSPLQQNQSSNSNNQFIVHHGHNGFNGAKPRFLSSSPAAKKMHPNNVVLSPSKMNLSAIHSAVSPGAAITVASNSNTSNNAATGAVVAGVQQHNNGNNNRGQTPDWIRDIFHHAKRGNREKLEMSTRGLESTLIRNLTDHLGNNLLHCACSAGHVSLLPFLTSRFSNELSGALNDENRKGLTPVQSAIKLGRLECVQWLVRHSTLREKLTSRDGERSLLHQAAKYGQSELVSWLAEEMSQQGLDVDQLDIASNSPLHLAAKHGCTTSAAALLHFGTQVTLKNDMGLKPHDCAKVMGQKECAEFLLLYETSLEMAKELYEVHTKREVLMAEHNELRSYFKDVLTIGKRLARERDEMCREIRRLHESTLELHDKMILEMQTTTGARNGKQERNQDSILQACNALHERWQQNSRQWFSQSSEAEQHKLWIAEESWRQVKTSTGSSGPSSLQDQTYHQRHLRDRLEEVKGRSLALPTSSGVAALASSEDEAIENDQISEEQLSNDYEDLNENDQKSENHHNQPPNHQPSTNFQQNQRRILANIAQRKKLATPAPSNRDETRTASRTSLDESLYSSVSNEVYTKIGSSPGSNTSGGAGNSVNKSNNPGFLSASGNNGTASVIEVIEPTASEEAEFKQALKEMNWSAVATTTSGLETGTGNRLETTGNRIETSPITIFPRDELRASMITTASSAASPVEFRHHARPAQVRSPTSSKASRDSIRSRYSASDLSPTKRLMEMGISVTEETRPAPNAEQHHVQAEHVQTNHVQTPNSVRKSSSSSSSTTAASNFFQKIASKTKLMKRSPIQMYANIDIDNAIGAMPSNHQSTNSKFTTNSPKFSPNSSMHHQHQEIYRNPDHILLDHRNQSASNNHNSSNEGEQAEEHILPDSFDEVSQIHPTSGGLETGNGNEKSSVSPSSRKSASSHASRGSQDSGIGIPIKQTGTGNNNIIATNHENVRSPGNNTVVMQVGVASTSHAHSNKRTADFSKAWYDVPSDDETEAPEADSLASIISHRGSSDDEN